MNYVKSLEHGWPYDMLRNKRSILALTDEDQHTRVEPERLLNDSRLERTPYVDPHRATQQYM